MKDGRTLAKPDGLAALDTITASLVARQSRSDDGSLSIPDQIAAMKEWCAKQNPPVIPGNVYQERDVSGRKPLEKRKGLLKAVEDVETGRSQMVLTCYFDRFVRSVATRAEVLVRVEDLGGSVMTMDFGKTSNATPVSKFTGTVLAAAAELIADQAGEKTHVTKQRNIDKGIPPFPRITPAYQRREDGRLEQHETNAPIIREAIELRLKGTSWTKLTRFLNDRGLVDAEGEPLTVSPSGVEAMFSSKLMIGEIHFGSFKPNLRAIDDPIMTRSEYRRLESAKATRGRYARSERLLARLGVLLCETCDSRMTVDNAKRGGADGKVYAYYRCGNRLCEAQAIVACDVADEVLRDEAIRLSGEVTGRASAAAELERARLDRVAAEKALDNAIRTLARLGGEAATEEVLDELQAARDAAVAEHERLALATSPDVTLRTADDWNRLTLDERRDVIRAVVGRAVVTPGRGAGRIAVEGRGK